MARKRGKYVTRTCSAIVYRSRSVGDRRKPPEKSAQGGSSGCRSVVYLGFIQVREAERHRPTLLDTSGIDPLCQTPHQPQPVGTLAHTNPEPAPSGSTIPTVQPTTKPCFPAPSRRWVRSSRSVLSFAPSASVLVFACSRSTT